MSTRRKTGESRVVPLDEDIKDRRFVTALARGLDVLRCFQPGDVGLGNLEIARRTGIPKPTVSRLTYTLTELGYLAQSEQHGTYQLAPGVLSLGYAMLSGLDIRERARPLMQELADYADATIALGARDRLNMVYLEVCRGPGAVTLRIDVGARLPIAPTSMGRALLAVLPEEERAFLMRHVKKHETRKDFARLKAGVEQAIAEIRERGFCTSFGDWRPEVNAAGVPVTSFDGNVYALNCGGPAFKVSREALENDYGPRLVALARQISAVDTL